MRDFYHGLKITQVLDPATLTGNGDATVTASVDMQGYNSCCFLALVGESADTLGASLHLQVEVQDSDDDSTFAAVADALIRADGGAAVTGAATGTAAKIDAAAEDDVVVVAEYLGSKRYVRLNLNRTGNHASGTPIGVVAMQGQGTYKPSA